MRFQTRLLQHTRRTHLQVSKLLSTTALKALRAVTSYSVKWPYVRNHPSRRPRILGRCSDHVSRSQYVLKCFFSYSSTNLRMTGLNRTTNMTGMLLYHFCGTGLTPLQNSVLRLDQTATMVWARRHRASENQTGTSTIYPHFLRDCCITHAGKENYVYDPKISSINLLPMSRETTVTLYSMSTSRSTMILSVCSG